MLDDNMSQCPTWSRASVDAAAPDMFSQVPARTKRLSTYCDTTEYDIFLAQENLVDFQQIEEGQFGPVYRANRQSETVCVPVALKPIKSSLSSQFDVSNFLREMAIIKCIRHPNVAQVYGVVNEANWIVMEYLHNGDLKHFLMHKKQHVFSLLKYMLNISMGMHYLSAKGFIHRKLAARNILVSEHEVCKVADLDLGQGWTTSHAPSTTTAATIAAAMGNIPEGVQDPYSMLRWMAPENVLNQHFSMASDVWSYGVVVWEMFNPAETPYRECDDRTCAERIVQGYLMEVPRECPERVAKIVKACWYQNPANRPSFLYISSLLNSIILE